MTGKVFEHKIRLADIPAGLYADNPTDEQLAQEEREFNQVIRTITRVANGTLKAKQP